MAEDEGEYEIVPHKEVLELKKQVDEIKAHPFGSTSEGKEMLAAIRRLSESMDNLTGLFQEAAEQMKLEERESELIGQKLDPLFLKIDDLIEQNKKIAKGILAVADMVKEDFSKARLRETPSMSMQQSSSSFGGSEMSSMSPPPIRVEASNIAPPTIGGPPMPGLPPNEFMQQSGRTGGPISPLPGAPPLPPGMPPLPPKTTKRRVFPF